MERSQQADDQNKGLSRGRTKKESLETASAQASWRNEGRKAVSDQMSEVRRSEDAASGLPNLRLLPR
jgi:hypothetical protein